MTMFAVPENEESFVGIPGRHGGVERLDDGVLPLPWIGVGDAGDEGPEGGIDVGLASPGFGQGTHGMGGGVGDPTLAGRLGHDLAGIRLAGIRGQIRMAAVAENEQRRQGE